MSVWYQRYWEPDKVRWLEGLFRQRLQRLFEPHDRDYACDESIERTILHRLPNADPQHGGNLDGYAYNTLKMSAHDVMRHLYGRPRPPVEVRRGGDVAVRIFELFVIERRCVKEIIAELELAERSVIRWTDWLIRNGRCHWRPTFVENTAARGADGVRDAMRPALETDDPAADDLDAHVWEVRLARLKEAKAALAPADRRMLTLLCVDGYDPATAAAMLDLSEEAMEQRHAALLLELERICDRPT